MKFVFACFLYLAAFAWSNIFSINAGIAFEKGYLEIDTTKTCNVDTTYINCSLEKGLAYYSTLDTAVAVFFVPRIASAAVYAQNPLTSKAALPSHTFTQVLRYEFLKWVEWGIIVMTKDSAQRLLDRLLPESENIENRHIVHKKVCDTDPSQCPNWGAYGGGVGGGLSDEDADRLPQKKVLLSAGSENPGMTALNRASRMRTLGTAKIPLGTGYKAFDVNGVYLYQGVWRGEFKSRGRAVILQFDNGKTVVFR